MFVEHPLIRSDVIEAREYQRSLADACLRSSTLVVLPTGLGKTVIALLVTAEVLQRDGGKVLFLAPTKPLVEQHASYLTRHLLSRSITLMTGEKDPAARRREWERNDVIVSTPQVIANDLREGRIDLGGVRLIIFDEAHRAVGNYSYVKVARAYHGRVVGFTASPGSSRARIRAVCSNLGICSIEVRTEEDADVRAYVQGVHMEEVEVDVPDGIREVTAVLGSLYDTYIAQLRSMGFMSPTRPPSVRYLIEVSKSLRARMRGKSNGYVLRALSIQACAIKVAHALELAETQGLTALSSYLEKLKAEAASKRGSKATQRLVRAPELGRIESILREAGEEHPKVPAVINIVSDQLAMKPGSRIMVFTNYRDSCETVVRLLSEVAGARVSKLVGQTTRCTDRGQRQREQVAVLDRFRRGEYNVVVATCVGEEGLDVADTDLVIFYEPVPSEIRSIQRRGRTGRSGPGRVVILVTRGTRDESSLVSSARREKSMRSSIRRCMGERADPAAGESAKGRSCATLAEDQACV